MGGSLADYLGVIILLSLLGLAVLCGVYGLVRYYLVPKGRELTARAEAQHISTKFVAQAEGIVNDLIYEMETNSLLREEIPERLRDRVYAIKDIQPRSVTRGQW